MKRYLVVILSTRALWLPGLANAQAHGLERWNWEVRTEVADPTKNPSNADLETGVGFQGTVSYTLAHGVGFYAGLNLDIFEADTSFAGNDVAYVQRGVGFGVQWKTQFAASNLGLRLRAGAFYGKISIHDDYYRDDLITDSNYGFGWEAGVALVIRLPYQWELTPGVRYTQLSRNVELNGARSGVDLDTVSIGIGFGRRF